MSLTFSKAGHAYELDGEPVESVTTLIGDGLPKPFLVGWAAKITAQYAIDNRDRLITLHPVTAVTECKKVHKQKRDLAGKRGTEIHRLAERVVTGVEVEVPDEIHGYVNAAADFLDDWAIEPIVVERPMASRTHRYAGTPDVIGRTRGGAVGVWDYKTAAGGIYGEAALQQSAYAFSEFWVDQQGDEHPTADLGITAAYGVHLRPDGYTVYPLEFGPHVFADFLAVAACARVSKRVRGYLHQAVAPPAESQVA